MRRSRRRLTVLMFLGTFSLNVGCESGDDEISSAMDDAAAFADGTTPTIDGASSSGANDGMVPSDSSLQLDGFTNENVVDRGVNTDAASSLDIGVVTDLGQLRDAAFVGERDEGGMVQVDADLSPSPDMVLQGEADDAGVLTDMAVAIADAMNADMAQPIDMAPPLVDAQPLVPDANAGGQLDYPPGPYGFAVGDVIEDHVFTDWQGQPFSFADAHRRENARVVVIMNTVAWCPSCAGNMIGVEELHQEFQNQGVEIIVSLYDDAQFSPANAQAAAQWRRGTGLTTTVVADGDEHMAPYFQPFARNTYLVIDAPTMRVLNRVQRFQTNEMRALIEAALND